MTDLFLYTTIWLAVAAWAATEVLRRIGRGRPAARLVWTAGAALLAVHTAIAFHARHAWSHDAAYASTSIQSEALTGVAAGWGLYLNYAFVIVWLADAAWWRAAPAAYERRSRAVDRALFAFFLFMMANGAVVFAASRLRWLGVLCVAAALAARAWPGRRLAAEGN